MDHHQQDEKHAPLISPAYCYGDFSAAGHPAVQSFEPSHELIGLPDTWRALTFFPKTDRSSAGVGFSQTSTEDPTAAEITNVPWQQPGDQGLSLSLFNAERFAGAGIQQPFHQHLSDDPRDGFYSRPANLQPDLYQVHPQQQLRRSNYLIPAQDLLYEICSLGGSIRSSKQQKPNRANNWEEGGSSSTSFNSMNLLELQKHKARLLSMLEEVDRKYRRYCEQMRSVVSAFEGVAGEGAATVYSTLASKAMSRHFRSLRDGITGQIQAAKKAMGEKDPVTPGSTRGETPRLRLLDQCLRKQKALQQAGMMEDHPWRPQRGLPERSVSVLRAWLFEHFLHPYPSDVDKHILARQTGLSRSQVSNWFINARVRLWKPMVEEMYLEETKEQDSRSHPSTAGYEDNNNSHSQLQSNRNPNPNPNPNPNTITSRLEAEDQKPAPGHLLINDSDSLASIINGKNPQQQHPRPIPGRAENFGMAVDEAFSSYNQSFSSGVSLTLGLQQHNDGGAAGLSLSPAEQHALFFSRESMDEFTITDDEAQNLPYRNLMGAQLLHDLAR